MPRSGSSALLRETSLFIHVGCTWAARERRRRPGTLNSRHVLSHSIGGNEVQGHSAAISVAGEGVFVLLTALLCPHVAQGTSSLVSSVRT